MYVYATYSGGGTIASDTITETALDNEDTRALIVITTFFSCLIFMFLSICRVVQIRVAFEAQNQYSGKWKILNRVAGALSVIGFIFMFLVSVVVHGAPHQVLLGFAMSCLFLCIWIAVALTVKERKSQYKSTGDVYIWDIVCQAGLSMLSTVCICIYMGYYINDCMSKGLSGADGCKVGGVGNVAEWIGFFGMNMVISTFALTFQHDDSYHSIQEWWMVSLRKIAQCRYK